MTFLIWLRNQSFHACSREKKNKGECENSAKIMVLFYSEDCDENQGSQNNGVGSL